MLEWLKWKIAGRELARLQRWEQTWAEYDRWLALSPEAEMVLRNMRAQVDGKALSLNWPPSKDGPWEISRLREVLKKLPTRSPIPVERLRAMRSEARASDECEREHWFILFARAIERAHGVRVLDGETK